MPKKTSKAVANKAAGAVAEIPEFMRGLAHEGTESLDADALETPRIILQQDMSEDIDGIETGDFYHSITEENLGKKLRIVPIHIGRQFLLWQPRHMGEKKVLARALDGRTWDKIDSFEVEPFKGSKKKVTWTTAPTVKESGLGDWGSTDPEDADSPPAATEMYAVLCEFPDRPDLGPAVVSLQRSQIKVAKKFNGKVKLAPVPSYGQIYEMSSFDDSSDHGDYSGYRFKADGLVTDEETFNRYRGIYETVKERGGVTVTPDQEGNYDEEASSGNDSGPEI